MEDHSEARVISAFQDSGREDAEVIMCICPVCGYSASSPRGQDEHMDNVHGEGRLVFPNPTAADNQLSPSNGYPTKPCGQLKFSPVISGTAHDSRLTPSGAQAFSTPQTILTGSDPGIPTRSDSAIATPSLPFIKRSNDALYDPRATISTTREDAVECTNWTTRLSHKISECDSSSGDTAAAVALQKVDSRRRYRCNMCSETFPWHGDLAEHLRLVHGMQKTRENTRSAKAGSFCCVHCKYVAKYQSELRRHMRLHWGVKPFVCVFCPYRSAWKGDLKRHMESHHRERFSSEGELIKIMSQFKNNAGTTLNGAPPSANLSKDSYSYGDMCQGKSTDSVDLSPKGRDTTSDEGDTGTSSGKTSGVAKPSLTEGGGLQCHNCSYRTSNSTRLHSHMNNCGLLRHCYKCPICGHKSLHEWQARSHLNSRHSAFEVAPVAIPDPSHNGSSVDISHPPFPSSPDSPESLRIDTPGVMDGMEEMPTPFKAYTSMDRHAYDTVPIDLSMGPKNKIPGATELIQTCEITDANKTVLSSLPGVPSYMTNSAVSQMQRRSPFLATSTELPPPPAQPIHPHARTISTVLPCLPTVSNYDSMGWPVPPTCVTAMNGDNPDVPATPAVSVLFNQWFMNGLMQTWHQHYQQLPTSIDSQPLPQVDTTAFPFAKVDPILLSTAPWIRHSAPPEHERVAKQDLIDLQTHMLKNASKFSSGSLCVPTGLAESETMDLSSNATVPVSSGVSSPFLEQRDTQRARRGRKSGQLRHGERLSTGSIGSKDEQWKRHQCSGCGHRSNWKWDINKHIKVAHPERTSITTVTLDIEEAKRTFGEYMNRLKLSRNRYLNDVAEGAPEQFSWRSGGTAASSFGQPVEGYYRPYQCSTCGHRSNWKWDVRKHIKQIHDNEAEVITLSLEEARRTIHQYKNYRRQQTRQSDIRGSAWYSSPDIATTRTSVRNPVNTEIKQNADEMVQETWNHSMEQSDEQPTSRLQSRNEPASSVTDERISPEVKLPTPSPTITRQRNKIVPRYPCRVCHLNLPTQKALTFHLSFRHKRPKNAIHSSIYVRRKLTRCVSDQFVHQGDSIARNSAGIDLEANALSPHEVDGPTVLPSGTTQSTSIPQSTLLVVACNQPPVHSQSVSEQLNNAPTDFDPTRAAPGAGVMQSLDCPIQSSHHSCSATRQGTPLLNRISITNQQSVTNTSSIHSSKRTDSKSTGIVRQMSALLDELLSLLGDSKDKCVEPELVATSTGVPALRNERELSHQVANLIHDVVLNKDTPPGINLSNCSSSSNEENHPITQRMRHGKPEDDSTIHTMLQHPEVGTRLLRLANVLRSVPNITNCT
ncbi:unnamed protein product [Dicrocoelium dendriticum]|nr:unnamed protein product [Dicrocoelium dendriticum]